MNLYKFLLVILFCPMLSIGQNLLPNASFEDTVPVKVTPLYLPNHWTTGTREGFNYLTPFNTNFPQWNIPSNNNGYQFAKTGNSYIGMLIYHLFSFQRNPRREYMQAQLKRPLVKDSTYCFEIHLSLADSSNFASRGQLGVYFSNTAVYSHIYEHLPYNPQIIVSPTQYVSDKLNWVKYSHTYVAQGGEQFITIGNFNDTTSLDTIFVGGGNINNINYRNTYYYIDDVWLSHCDSVPDSLVSSINGQSLDLGLSVYPNPFEDRVTVNYRGNEALAFRLFNLLGQEQEMSATKSREGYEFNLVHLPKGIYLLKVGDGKREETVKLIRK